MENNKNANEITTVNKLSDTLYTSIATQIIGRLDAHFNYALSKNQPQTNDEWRNLINETLSSIKSEVLE